MNKLDVILFDLDGTLLDTIPDVHDCANQTLKQMNFPTLPVEQIQKAIGPGPGVFAKIVLGEKHTHRIDDFFEIFRPLYHDHCINSTRPFPGIMELLDKFDHYKMAVASNKPKFMSTRILKGLDLYDRFDLVIGPESVTNAKPEPDMIHFAAEHFNVNVEQTILIGDTDNDILAARAAGCYSILAGWGYSHEIDQLKKDASFYAEKPLDVIPIIHNLTQTKPVETVNA